MLTCKNATHLMSEALDRRLSRRERFNLRVHLLFCRGCRTFQGQMDFLRTASRSFTGWREGGDQ